MSNEKVKEEIKPEIVAENKELIGGYSSLVKQIPWDSLGKLPEKFGTIGKMFGVKAEDIDIKQPLENIIGFVKLMVTDINKLRVRTSRYDELEKRVKDLESKIK